MIRAERVLALAVCAVMLATALAAAVATAEDRRLSRDEAEYLHAGFLLHDGLRIYRDFFEHHAPFLFQILSALVPEPAAGEVPSQTLVRYVVRARSLFAPIGIAAIAVAAWLAWRITRWTGAPALVIASLIVPAELWTRVITDVRHDGPSLLLFWSGAPLLLGSWRDDKRTALASGIGIGLGLVSAALNPKWPLACLVLGVVHLMNVWRVRRAAIYAIGPALIVVAIPLAALLTVTTIRDYLAFTFDYSVQLARWTTAGGMTYASSPLAYCPAWFKGLYPIAAAVVVVALQNRLDSARRRTLLAVVAIAIAAAVEVRFLHSWPNVWTQFLLMWCFSMAVLYGAAAGLLRELLPQRARPLLGIAAILIIGAGFAHAFSVRFTPLPAEEVTASARSMLGRLQPGDTVWIGMDRHPILARDAHYFWFGFAEHIPFILDAQKNGTAPSYLPRVTEADLPPCRAARGIDPHVRFTSSDDEIPGLHETARCIETLLAAGRAKRPRLPARDFVEIVR